MVKPGVVGIDIECLRAAAQVRYSVHGRSKNPEVLVSQARLRTLSFQPEHTEKSTWRHKGYKYEFVDPPRQRDPIMPLLIKAIRELCQDQRHGILVSNTNIRVTPTTSHLPFWPPSRAGPGNFSKCYTFKQDWQQFPATVEISGHTSDWSQPLTADKLIAKFGNKWIPIKEWLLLLPDPTILKKRSPMMVSLKWWQRNGKTFPLMELPSEIRLIIFEYALGGELYPLPTIWREGYYYSDDLESKQQAPISMGIGLKREMLEYGRITEMIYGGYEYAIPDRSNISAPCTALQLVSKDVQEGVLKAGWEGLRKCFLCHQIFTAVADSKTGLAVRFNFLGKIRLDFTNDSWFRFLGIEIHPIFQQDATQSLARYLSSLSELTDLEIFFRSPGDGYRGDPWASSRRTSCQTTLVDWILKLAFPHIKHIYNVKLIGFIKKPQREHWQRTLHLACNKSLSDYDEAAEIDAIFETPIHLLPPSCICRKTCLNYHPVRYVSRWNLDFDEHDEFDFEDDEVTEIANQTGGEQSAVDRLTEQLAQL
ncbi:hypothetical protein BDV96DRAFT_603691 [Lophiotrema nucula]|uniref:Uncharacterized protein n=1 Tax=Lophiotrema nucula TaxID=690887 RepID=A0A6A5YUM9_9PLEO|nr:hypothetical protein BDV96DRAFT_603691 [Lophiotrema nucula]